MNLQQLRYLSGIVEHGLNVSKAATALHTSQPGVSRQIKLLEEELRAELLVRQGNRIAALTDAGQAAAEIAARILRDVESLRAVGADFADADTGTLVVATTHVHAKYILLPIVQRFRQRFPQCLAGAAAGHAGPHLRTRAQRRGRRWAVDETDHEHP